MAAARCGAPQLWLHCVVCGALCRVGSGGATLGWAARCVAVKGAVVCLYVCGVRLCLCVCVRACFGKPFRNMLEMLQKSDDAVPGSSERDFQGGKHHSSMRRSRSLSISSCKRKSWKAQAKLEGAFLAMQSLTQFSKGNFQGDSDFAVQVRSKSPSVQPEASHWPWPLIKRLLVKTLSVQ